MNYKLLLCPFLLIISSTAFSRTEKTAVVFRDADTGERLMNVSISSGEHLSFLKNGNHYNLQRKKSSSEKLVFMCDGYHDESYDDDFLSFHQGTDTLTVNMIPNIEKMRNRWSKADFNLKLTENDSIPMYGFAAMRDWMEKNISYSNAITHQYSYFCGNDMRTELTVYLSSSGNGVFRIGAIKVNHDHYDGYIDEYFKYLLPKLPNFIFAGGEIEVENVTSMKFMVQPAVL